MTMTVKREFHLARQSRGTKRLRDGVAPAMPAGRIPRVSRLMALAIHCERLIATGVVSSQAELAERGQVTTARMAQIMSLLNLAPDLQEAILFLPRVERGCDPVKEMDLRPIAAILDWRLQRRMWQG